MPFFANGDYYDEPARDYASEMELLNTYDPIYLSPEEQAAKEQKDVADIAAREAWYATPEYKALVAAGANEPGYGNRGLDFFSSIGNFISGVAPYVLAVAPLVVPGIGQVIGSAILSAAGITGASAAVTAGVGAAALSAASTAAQGGSVEDVLKSAASAGVASGLNISMGGGVSGAVTGSTAGTIIRGGDASQVLTNAFAAGVGAGVQGAMTENPDAGKIIGTAARTYIATGGNVDQTLLNTAASAIGTLDQPAKNEQQLQAASTTAKVSQDLIEPFEQGGLKYEEQPDGTAKVTDQAGNERTISYREFSKILNADVPAQPVSAPTPTDATALAPQTVVAPAPVVSPVVTDLDLVKQVAAQPTPTVDPKALERVIVQGQGANVANVAPVETTVPSTTVPSTATVATPTPAQPFPTPIITPVAEPEKEAPVVTDIPPVEPPQTEFERKFINETVAAPVTTGPEFQQVTVRETVPRPVEPVEFEQKTIRETVPKVSDVVAETPAPPIVAPPSVAPPTELEKVTVTAKREEEAPTITDIVAKTMEPPPAPPPPPAPEVKAEETKKEEAPKKESKKLYPTVTSVPPPAKPGRQPIITGASPARLLADALAAYRPAGAIEGEESGKVRPKCGSMS